MLIAGYNEFSKEKREQMDQIQIGKDSSKISFWTGILLIIFPIAMLLLEHFERFLKVEDQLLIILLPVAILIYFVIKQVIKSKKYYDQFK